MALNKLRLNIIEWLFPTHEHKQAGEFTSIFGLEKKRKINETTALSNPAVWACVRVISETIATLPATRS